MLQAIRDWLKVEEAAKFGAQLPELLRGVYYEHWQPARAPVKRRSKVDFVARVDQAFHADPLIFTSEAITTVFQFLSDKITPGEIASCLTGGRQSAVANLLPCGMRLLNFGVFELRQLEQGESVRSLLNCSHLDIRVEAELICINACDRRLMVG